MSGQPLRVGNGAGFWGDNLDAPLALAQSGQIDVLTLEYLAELTLAILAHLRSKNPSGGYITDFPDLLTRIAPYLRDNPQLRVVTNAGGLNPGSLAALAGRILDDEGLGRVPVGVVLGDDILEKLPGWVAGGEAFPHLETNAPIAPIVPRLMCANAYLGARPIRQALEGGARIVLTGRVADASLTVGPAAHHFEWRWEDWDRLAGASVAGHLIECGAQVTGGLWHDWSALPDPAQVGYPIAIISEDGSCRVSKVEGTGGIVEVANVAEQIVYEIDDPSRYRTPDVDVDLTTVELSPSPGRNDVVQVTGTKGRPPSDRLKVSAVYRDGWTASGMLAVVGRDAASKARASAEIVLDRVRRAGFTLEKSLVECFGAGDVAPGVLPPGQPPFEVVLRLTVRDPRREAVERFCREIAPLITSGPPGLVGYATGRPVARPAFGYWPTLVRKADVAPRVEVREAAAWRTISESQHGPDR